MAQGTGQARRQNAGKETASGTKSAARTRRSSSTRSGSGASSNGSRPTRKSAGTTSGGRSSAKPKAAKSASATKPASKSKAVATTRRSASAAKKRSTKTSAGTKRQLTRAQRIARGAREVARTIGPVARRTPQIVSRVPQIAQVGKEVALPIGAGAAGLAAAGVVRRRRQETPSARLKREVKTAGRTAARSAGRAARKGGSAARTGGKAARTGGRAAARTGSWAALTGSRAARRAARTAARVPDRRQKHQLPALRPHLPALRDHLPELRELVADHQEALWLAAVPAGIEATRRLRRGRRVPVQQCVDIAVPLAVAYAEWMELEFLPEGAHRVEKIDRHGEGRLTGKVPGPLWSRNWEAEIIDERENESFAWRSVKGSDCAGLITFHALSERLTRLELQLDVIPVRPIEAAEILLRVADGRAETELRRFKARLETLNPDSYGVEEEFDGEDNEEVDEDS